MRIDIDGAGEFQAARVRGYDGGVEISVIDVQHVQFVQRMEGFGRPHFACKAQLFKKGRSRTAPTEIVLFQSAYAGRSSPALGRQVINLFSAKSRMRSITRTNTARMMMPAKTPTASKLPSERAIR